MHQLKKAIFTEIRKHNKDSNIVDLSDEKLNLLIFHHPNGLRLTLSGFIHLKKIFTVYSFEIPNILKSKHRICLAKMEFPYFFTTKRLILFSEMDAMMIKLQGGIEKFLESYTHLINTEI